ncbi:MAG: carbohydrate kinase [Alphaproteobacteria bacterium]|nr:carbohydrate kinase [Alphaproteobacteria bacterium]
MLVHATPSPQPATPNIDLLVIGEALIDLIPSKQGYMPSIGGSPLNVAVAAARLGVKTGFACGLSTDTHGEAIREYLQCNQVDTSLCPIVDKPTPLVMVTQGQDGEQYRFYLADTAERHGDQSALWQIDPPQYVHFGSYAAFLEPTQTGIVELLHHWKRHHDVIVSFDPNVRPLILPSAEDARAHCHHLLGLVDVIRLSEQDATWLYPERSSEQTAMAWHQHTHKPVVLTKGQQGATLYDKAGQYEQAALAVEVWIPLRRVIASPVPSLRASRKKTVMLPIHPPLRMPSGTHPP